VVFSGWLIRPRAQQSRQATAKCRGASIGIRLYKYLI
jgi:hypothetical protein